MDMQRLYTQDGRNIPDIPWYSYPRPQMRRQNWMCLNGEWKFTAGDITTKIKVPFCPEALLSGIEHPPAPGTLMVYEREFVIPEEWQEHRVLLHFGAVSCSCSVYINEVLAGRHNNAYLPFTIDITDKLRSNTNSIKVITVNDLSANYPRGKQSIRRGGMWYTPVSGIWQTVWLEPVPDKWIQGLFIETGRNYADIQIDGFSEGYLLFNAKIIPVQGGKARLFVDSPVFWSPDNPHLYRFSVFCGEDTVESYFALRSLSIETINGIQRLCLNGKPFFFNGVLDQGYWSDGLYTPPSHRAYQKDIFAMKSLGFNTLRKHVKIEPEQFYYDCDRFGMIVFQDMVNNGEYRFLRDTLLPTIGLKKRSDLCLNTDIEARKSFLDAMDATVMLLQNHPCICLWTIFNEGWGQFCADQAYARLRDIDQSRFIDSTSGWFHQTRSDVYSFHCYFRKPRIKACEKPLLLSEFGGYSYKIPDHSFNLKKTYGYKKFKKRKRFINSLNRLYRTVFHLKKSGLSGAVYTQLSDVEDETNGFLTFDRELIKIMPEEFTANRLNDK